MVNIIQSCAAGSEAARSRAGVAGRDTLARLARGALVVWAVAAAIFLVLAGEAAADAGGANSRGSEQAGASARSFQQGRLEAGAVHNCALLVDGTVRCWGSGANGRLGYGNTNSIGDNEAPGSAGPVDLGGREAVAVSAGLAHTCALLDDGTVRCWGAGANGRLGYGNTNSIGDNEAPGSAGPVDLGGREAVAVSAGDSHTCALLDDGAVRCWGLGGSGRLGYGNEDDIGDNETPASAGPVDLGAGREAVAVSAGGGHTCALLDNGTVRCWGFGGAGRLGYNNTDDIGDNETPGSVGPVDLGGREALAVSTGAAHSCALLENGTVRCWGFGNAGRLGYGNANSIGDNETPGSVGPVQLGGEAVAVSAADSHTCALLDDGNVRCWGFGGDGRLGYGNANSIGDNELPSSVGPVDLGREAVAVSGGFAHTCALLDNGTVRCWGFGGNGRLGYGNSNSIGDNEAPGSAGPVDTGSPHGAGATATSAGDDHSCALLDDGTVRCWGRGASGRLGYGNTDNTGDNETPGSVGPVDLGGREAAAVSTGAAHTCALLDDGTVRCWGSGSFGRLGYGNENSIGNNETPGSVAPVDLGGREAVAVSAGGGHTCALLDNGTVRCWGGGGAGQLGYGNTDDIGDNETPGSVGPVDLGREAVGVSAGDSHTCALLDNGTVRCWGFGSHGQLGYPSTDYIGDNETPGSVGPVDLGREAVAVSAGLAHTCALLDNGTVRCWGEGNFGRLGYANTERIGDDETPGSVGPVDLGAGRQAVGVSVGALHTCALLDDGTVRCWGLGANGRLGYGNSDDIGDDETPGSVGPVDLGREVLGVSAGFSHTCALLDNGTVRCWGLGDDGQLGYGNVNTIGDNETPASAGPVDLFDDSPAAVDDVAVVAEDSGATTIDVLQNDTDADGGPKTIAAKTDGVHGQVAITNGGADLTYTPAPGYCNDPPGATLDSFTYTLNGGSSATVSVTVSCVDDSPAAVDDVAVVAEDSGATTIDVLQNDTDADGGPKTIAAKTDGVHGQVAITNGGADLTYTPAPGYCNDPPGATLDSFTYTLNGGSSATVSVTVSCVDDPEPSLLHPRRCDGATIRGSQQGARDGQGRTVVEGTAGDDVIVGTQGPDVIRAGRGDDLVCALGEDDRVLGGGGADTLNLGHGRDKGIGGGGEDVVRGSLGGDLLLGRLGDDALHGNLGPDRLAGGAGRDLHNGGSGRDFCAGVPAMRIDARRPSAAGERDRYLGCETS